MVARLAAGRAVMLGRVRELQECSETQRRLDGREGPPLLLARLLARLLPRSAHLG
jgi:hypothetical protein